MPRPAYKEKLTDLEVLALFDAGNYSVDLATGLICGPRGKPLYVFYGNKTTNVRDGDAGTPWTRLYCQPKHRSITVSRIVWIVGNRMAVPSGFEIHHYDCDNKNNAFDNLYALSTKDHCKLHRLLADINDEVVF